MSNSITTQTQRIPGGGQPADAPSRVSQRPANADNITSVRTIATELAKNNVTLTGRTNPNQDRKVYAKEVQPIIEQENAIATCEKITQKPGISPNAKAVYQHIGGTLRILKEKIGNDFSPENIYAALISALKGRTDLSALGGTGTVGMYSKDIDGSEFMWDSVNNKNATMLSEQGKSAPDAWGWQENKLTGEWLRVPKAPGQEECLAKCRGANMTPFASLEEAEKNA